MSTAKMTYAEAMEIMDKCNIVGKQCLLQVKYNREGMSGLLTAHFLRSFMHACMLILHCTGYEKIESRDNFHVKAKIAHKSRQPWSELSFEKGDVFHVVDTLPAGEGVKRLLLQL